MKTPLKITILLLLLLFSVAIVSAQDKITTFSNLPAKAQQFLKQFFSEKDVAKVRIETEYFIKKEYEVVLKNGSEMQFDTSGEWEKLKMKETAVPAQLVPAAISQHIHKSFPNTFVKEIERGSNGYEVEISNGLDLEFSKAGKFIRVDD